MSEQCPKCGSNNLDSGRVCSGGGYLGYRSDNASVFTLTQKLAAVVCLDCGNTELKLAKVPPKAQ